MPGPGYSLIDEDEESLVMEVIRSRELSRYRFDPTGEEEPSMVYRFEREMEERLGVRHCLAVNSCTCALLAALTGLGVGPGDEVIVPGYTFIASIAAIAYARAVPVLAEVDDSLTLDPHDVRRKITPRTRAIMPVHMLGAPCDMAALRALADEHDLFLLEDVAQACGASYRGARLGSLGDAGAFSLNLFKTITAGDGGFLTTDDTAVYERAFAFHDHGFKPHRLALADADSLLGLNLRMHELTGAVALAQGRKLDRILGTLRRNKARFLDALGEIPGARRRRIHDADGECGTLAVFLFDEAERARAVAEALGACTLLDSGRHYYGNMAPLRHRRMPTAGDFPWECDAQPSTQRYEVGLLPATDDLLSRAVALSVGVVDSYLGASFGIDILSTDDQITDTAAELRRRLATV